VGLVAQNATAILPNAPTSVRAAAALAAAALAAAALAAAALAAAALNARRRCPQRPPPLPSTPAAAALNARRRGARRLACAAVALSPRGLYSLWLYRPRLY